MFEHGRKDAHRFNCLTVEDITDALREQFILCICVNIPPQTPFQLCPHKYNVTFDPAIPGALFMLSLRYRFSRSFPPSRRI
jgi:hypothetical protein